MCGPALSLEIFSFSFKEFFNYKAIAEGEAQDK